MALSTKLSLINAKVEQLSGGTLNLSGDTVIYPNTGELKYAVHPSSFTPTSVVDAIYVTGQTAGKLDTPIFTGYTAATQTMYNDVGDPTGFVDNENIVVSYNSTNRTITLSAATGNVEYYYKGVKHTLSNPWTSTGHTSDTQAWFLYSTDGKTFAWSTAAWGYDDVQVAVRPANTSWAIREIHGLMPWETHQELHRTIGTYRVSGFGLTDGTYQIQPASPANADNTPGFEAGTIADEDLQTSLTAWGEGSYTQLHFTSTGTVNFATAQSHLFRPGTNYPKINPWNGTAFTETEMAHNEYANWYVIRIPVTSDANSQLYRAVVLQPQFKYSSLDAAQAESPLTINLGDFTNLAPEYVIVERITLHTDSGYTSTNDVRIEAWSILTGAKFNQTSTTPGAGSVTAGNVSVTPLSPFTETNMQDLSDTYAQCITALEVITGNALTGTTGSYIGTTGRNVCIDAVGTIVLGAALTGTTNGLTDDGRVAKLGAALTENTTINLSTFDLKFADDSVQYAANYSSTYVARSLVDAGYVTGLTSGLDADIAFVSAATAANTADIANLAVWSGQTDADIAFVSAATAANTADIANLAVWSGQTDADIAFVSAATAANTADIANLATWSGTTDSRLDVIEGQYITGGTSGLLPDGSHDLKLGGAITENTTLFGSYIFGVNANKINLTGLTSGITLGGSGLYIPATLTGGGDLLCINSGTKQVGLTSLSAFGGITGGTNGICNFPNQRLGLGGVLTQDSTICGAGFDLNLGTAASKLDVLDIQAAGTSNIVTGGLTVCSSGATITDLRAVKEGICYAGDYSSSFVGNSLVTKCYVDTVAAGLQPHDVVRVATTTNIDLDGGETIDGIAVSNGDRVLVKDQSTPSQNGIYVVNTAGAWTRATDFDFTPAGEIVNGDLVPVFTGSTQANTLWVVTSPDPIASGNSINFTIFSRLLGVVAGDGIDVTPVGANQTISVDLMTNGGLAICSTKLAVADTIAGNGLSWGAGVINANATSGEGDINVKFNGSDNLVVSSSDINTALGGVISGVTNGLSETSGVARLGGTLTQATTITGSDSCTFTYVDSAIGNKQGIVYGGDYCATFVDRSLVDKAYVVRYTTGLTSGLDSRIDLLESWSATTETRVDNLETDVTALGAVSGITLQSITGVTNGLTKVGAHDAKLGGTLNTGTTTITIPNDGLTVLDFVHGGSCLRFEGEAIGICNDNWELTVDGNTNAIYLGKSPEAYGLFDGGGVYFSSTGGSAIRICSGKVDICGTPVLPNANYNTAFNSEEDGILFRDSSDGNSVHLVTLDALISGITTTAITGATNGLTAVGQDVQLGGQLIDYTGIDLAAYCLVFSSSTTNYFTQFDAANDTFNVFTNDGAGLIMYNNNAVIGAGAGASTVSIDGTNDVICLSTDGGAEIQVCGKVSSVNIANGNGGSVYIAGDNSIQLTTDASICVSTLPAGDETSQYVVLWDGDDTEALTQVPVSSLVATGSAITGATNGLNITSKCVGLGGALTQATTINLSGNTLNVDRIGNTQMLTISEGYELIELNVGLGASYLQLISDCATIHSAGICLASTSGNITLSTPPNSGSTTDAVLVWDSNDYTIKQIPATNLGQDNNDYEKAIVTTSTGLTTSSPYVILVNHTAPVTITLPATPFDGQAFKIKDAANDALTNNITIARNGNNIDTQESDAVINTDSGALELVYDSTLGWFTLAFVN